MTLPSADLIRERAFAYHSQIESHRAFVQEQRSRYFLNAWEYRTAPRMRRSGTHILDLILTGMIMPANVARIRTHLEAIATVGPLVNLDLYFLLVLAYRESGENIFSRSRRHAVPRALIEACRSSRGASSGTALPCSGLCDNVPRPTRPVSCYDTFLLGGLDNLGSELDDWIDEHLIPAGYNNPGPGKWEVGWRARSAEGPTGDTTVYPAFVPTGELFVAYAVKLLTVQRRLEAAITGQQIGMVPLPSLEPFFRRFLLQVTFGGPYGSASLYNSRLDCDAVISARPVTQYCLKPDGSRETVGPAIQRHMSRPWEDGAPCDERPSFAYGIRTVLNFLRETAVAGGAASPTLLDLQRVFTSDYRRIYCRIAGRRFRVALVRAIEAAALERTRLFEPGGRAASAGGTASGSGPGSSDAGETDVDGDDE